MRITLVAGLIATLLACAPDPGEGKPKAKVEPVDPPKKVEPVAPAPPAAPPAAAAAPAGTPFKVDVTKSKITALGAKITATHPIEFKDFTGTVTVDGTNVTGVSFEVKMPSLVADHPKLTEHLLTPDFFDVAKFPTSTFKSSEIKAGSETAGMTHTIVGELSVHGQARKITFPARLEIKPDGVSASSEFVLNRKDFGLVYPGKPDDLIQDNVKMTVQLVAPKAG
jgi:polyisoprenoid-binding protein YceI